MIFAITNIRPVNVYGNDDRRREGTYAEAGRPEGYTEI